MHVMATLVTVTQKTIPWVPEVFSHVQLFSSHLVFRQSWTKVLRHFYISGACSSSHKSNPSPHPTNNIGCTILKTHASGFIRGSKHQETDENTRPQAECFYCIVSSQTKQKNMQWYIFLLLSSPNERTIIRNIASTCMINCVGVVGVWPWVKMERQDLGSWKQFTKNAH